MRELLVEKYRPKEFNEVVGCPIGIEEVVNNGDIHHCLFEGVQGSGKTTLAKIIIKKLNAEVLLLNASKDRGIDVIRNIIEPFAKKKSDNIKIVFLDEMDATTPQFQTSLRNLMETYAHSTRFIGTCNYISKIIPALQSRFSVYKFGKYDTKQVFDRLNKIIIKEEINMDVKVLRVLVNKYKDDIRGAINFLDANRLLPIITIDMISHTSKAMDILKRLLNKEWFSIRQELINQSIEYEPLLEELDRIVFVSNLSIDKKIIINRLIAKGLYEMYFSFNKEISFSSTLANIQHNL